MCLGASTFRPPTSDAAFSLTPAPEDPARVAQMRFDFGPLERNTPPNFVKRDQPALHQIVDRSHSPLHPLRHFGFGYEPSGWADCPAITFCI